MFQQYLHVPQRNDDVIVTSLKNAVFARRETHKFILPLLWLPNSPDLNKLTTVCGNTARQGVQNMYDYLDDLKHRIKTEWSKLDHAVIAASLHQWRRLRVRQGRRWSFSNTVFYLDTVFSDNYNLSYCR